MASPILETSQHCLLIALKSKVPHISLLTVIQSHALNIEFHISKELLARSLNCSGSISISSISIVRRALVLLLYFTKKASIFQFNSGV